MHGLEAVRSSHAAYLTRESCTNSRSRYILRCPELWSQILRGACGFRKIRRCCDIAFGITKD